MANSSSPVTIRPRRPSPILVCRKCLKRVKQGRELKRALKTELKDRSAAQDGKSPRLVLTACLGICPKRAVVLASGATLERGEYLLLASADGTAEAADLLMPPLVPSVS